MSDRPIPKPQAAEERPFNLSRRAVLQQASLLGASGVTGAATAAESVDFRRRWSVRFELNGQAVAADVEARTTLLDWLREKMALTGAKKGCNEGACGACTVLMDGRHVNACLVLVAQCGGSVITTIEGLAGPDGTLHPVQKAFIDHDAFQCGFCTPGQVVSAVSCIKAGQAADEASVKEWMSGNLCRCGAYPQITAAVLHAASMAAKD